MIIARSFSTGGEKATKKGIEKQFQTAKAMTKRSQRTRNVCVDRITHLAYFYPGRPEDSSSSVSSKTASNKPLLGKKSPAFSSSASMYPRNCAYVFCSKVAYFCRSGDRSSISPRKLAFEFVSELFHVSS